MPEIEKTTDKRNDAQPTKTSDDELLAALQTLRPGDMSIFVAGRFSPFNIRVQHLRSRMV